MKTVTFGLVLLAILVVACGPTGGRRSPDWQDASTPRVWPEPPATPRIRFLKTMARPADLGVTPSWWQRLGRIIAGREEDWLIRPTAVAEKNQVLYVADPGAQALWVLDLAAARFRKVQTARQQPLVSPVALALGRDDRIYLADSFLAKIFVYGADLTLTTTISDTNLRRPAGLAFDPLRDRLYVADSASHRLLIYGGDGRPAGTIGQRGSGDGDFNFPTHVAVDATGAIYVTDSLGFRIQVFTPDGHFATAFGHHGDSSGNFARPKGVGVDSHGHIYVVDALFDTIQIFDRRGRFLLAFGERGVGPGQFWLPVGLFIDSSDRIYVADSYNQRIQIFQYVAGHDDE